MAIVPKNVRLPHLAAVFMIVGMVSLFTLSIARQESSIKGYGALNWHQLAQNMGRSSLPAVTRLPYAFIGHGATSSHSQTMMRGQAVCIGGYRATMLVKSMAKSLIEKVLIPNDADLFVYITVENITSFPIDEFRRLYQPWLKSFVIIQESAMKAEVEQYRVPQPGNTILGEINTRIFLKMHKCYGTLIAPFELARGMMEYHHIFYTRPDIYYATRLHMTKYSDPDTLYSPRPSNFKTYVQQDEKDPVNDGLVVWPGDVTGINDQCFLGNSRVVRMVSHALWMLFPSIPELKHMHEAFAERQLWWVVRERLNLSVKAIPDLANTICHDGRECYDLQGVPLRLEDEGSAGPELQKGK